MHNDPTINDLAEIYTTEVLAEKKVSAETDIALEPKELKGWFKKNYPRIKYKILSKSGPGGGWPEIEVSGERKEVVKFLTNAIWGGDREEVKLIYPELFESTDSTVTCKVESTKEFVIAVAESAPEYNPATGQEELEPRPQGEKDFKAQHPYADADEDDFEDGADDGIDEAAKPRTGDKKNGEKAIANMLVQYADRKGITFADIEDDMVGLLGQGATKDEIRTKFLVPVAKASKFTNAGTKKLMDKLKGMKESVEAEPEGEQLSEAKEPDVFDFVKKEYEAPIGPRESVRLTISDVHASGATYLIKPLTVGSKSNGGQFKIEQFETALAAMRKLYGQFQSDYDRYKKADRKWWDAEIARHKAAKAK